MGALLPPPRTRFEARVRAIDDATAERMRGRSWHDHPRCPPLAGLALVEATHLTMEGGAGRGELVVAAPIAGAVVTLLARLHAIGFPIASMRLVDDHDADDDRSMAAGNSSAFNFRTIAGTDQLSQHAFGLAIDLNPAQNPMVWPGNERFVPPCARPYLDRRRLRPGMIVRPGPVTAIFDELGWEWGGDWRHVADLHHIVWSRRHQ
ncbi:MAG TPA: M15 family metallopeptidase [Kofleriaceae bacterium]|nr:M15 family metallopeptidase [Kofleriaceae bacterium]